MFSKQFLAWVGVGLLGVVTIPVVAAPRLAKLTRRPVAERREPVKAAAAKAKPAPTTRPVAKASAKAPGKIAAPAAVVAKRSAPPVPAKKAAKPVVKAAAKKPTAAATARKLLH